jgi:hypothetical protein
MCNDLTLLRALARLARKGRPATILSLMERAGGGPRDVREALRRLERAALVTRSPAGAALTLAGLAVAVSSAPAPLESTRAPRLSTVPPAAGVMSTQRGSEGGVHPRARARAA